MAITPEAARRAQLEAVAEAYFEGMGKKDMSHVPWDDQVVLRSPLAPGGSRHPTGGTRGSPRLVCIALSCARRHAHHRTYFNEGFNGDRLAVGCWDYQPTLHAACGGPLHGQCRGKDYAAGESL